MAQSVTRAALWQTARVTRVKDETYRVKSFTLALPRWLKYRPGQHFDVRLTAPDGYQAQRSYSVASSPETEGEIELTVEMIEEGEVSPFFHQVVQVGDELEVRGPIGGPFTWTTRLGGPLLLVGGGSGIVPLMSMLRHRRAQRATDIPVLLLYSARGLDDVIFRSELDEMAASDPNVHIVYTLTRRQPHGWTGYSRRIDEAMLSEAQTRLGGGKLAYACGPTAFVETAADALVRLGLPAEAVQTERFGPSAA